HVNANNGVDKQRVQTLTHTYTSQLKVGLAALKRDVASSIRMCSRDFAVLGHELVDALARQEARQHAMAHALDVERKGRERLQNKVLELQGNIRVVCRVRPVLPHELALPDASKQVVEVPSTQGDVSVYSPVDGTLYRTFSFHRVFDASSTQHPGIDGRTSMSMRVQRHVFKEVAPLVHAALDGYHACIFAYGQTGSGKTHTMQGPKHDRGVYFRAADLIFQTVQAQRDLFDFRVTLQMVEIYNEEVYDLLAAPAAASTFAGPALEGTTSTEKATRSVVEIRHGEQGVYLKDCSSSVVTSAKDIYQTIDHGNANRSVHATNKNEHSSRSHSVVMLDIKRRNKSTGETHKGRLVLIDLAGSERLSKTEATGMRLREAQHINKSLSAVGDVMAALLAKDKHIPFRNSKLTHLLQDSLGSENKSLMMVQVSPTAPDANESVNTLKFAARVSHIQLGNARRSERAEITRLNSLVAAQATQLQQLQEKLATELELRKKYEKRLEEYRQEDSKRRQREEDTKKHHKHQLDAFPSANPAVDLSFSVNRRRSQENVSENILRSKNELGPLPEGGIVTPQRRTKRTKLFGSAMKTFAITPPSSLAKPKRKPEPVFEVRSILKKQRVETSCIATKQVSFDLLPRVTDVSKQPPMTPLRSIGGGAARKPTIRVRTPTSSAALG
ncbi:TPA: hypothetical protein N0F65_000960, partial [Lagenidium giganteum]